MGHGPGKNPLNLGSRSASYTVNYLFSIWSLVYVVCNWPLAEVCALQSTFSSFQIVKLQCFFAGC